MEKDTKKLKQLFRKYVASKGAKDERPPPVKGATNAPPNVPKGMNSKEKVKEVKKPQKPIGPVKRSTQVEKAKRIEEEEKEEFEVVKGARPAVCRALDKRQSKMRWKKEEVMEKEPFMEKAHADVSGVEKSDIKAAGEIEKQSAATIEASKEVVFKEVASVGNGLKKNAAVATTEVREAPPTCQQVPSGTTTKTEAKVGPPAVENSSSTGASATTANKSDNQKSDDDQKVVLPQLRQEIEDAKAALQKQKEMAIKEQEEIKKMTSVLKTVATEEDTVDDATLSVATRTLEVIKRNQLLENALNYNETKEMHAFFSNGENKPNANVFFLSSNEIRVQVVVLLDKAMSVGMDMLVNRPHLIDDVIDNQMRQFLMNRVTAKTVLLEVMLDQPSFMPAAWRGGRMMMNSGNADLKKEMQKKAIDGMTEVGVKKNTKERSIMAGVVDSQYKKSTHLAPPNR